MNLADASARRGLFVILACVASAAFAQSPTIPPAWGTPSDPDGFAQWAIEGDHLVATVRARPKLAAAYDPGTNFKAPRCTREVTGDFTAELTVLPMAPQPEINMASYDWISAGLVVIADSCTGVRFDRGYRRDKRAATEAFVWDRANRYRMASQWVIDVPIDAERPIRYKVQRRGNRLLAWIGQDDKPWAPVYMHNIAGWPATVQVGPLVTSFTTAAVRAEFADFKITPDGGATVAPRRADPDGSPAFLLAGPEIPGWGHWYDPMGVANWTKKETGLALHLTGVGIDLNAKAGLRNAPMVLREIDGDFTATLLLQTGMRPNNPARSPAGLWQNAGLVLTSDGDQYLRFIFQMQEKFGRHGGVQLNYGAGGGGSSTLIDLFNWSIDQPLWLRLTRRGDHVTAEIKPDNGEWQMCDQFTLPGWPKRICAGVLAGNLTGNRFTAEFGSLSIEQP